MASTSVGLQQIDFDPGFYEEKPHESGVGFYRFYRTPECWSGHGISFSGWFSITSGEPPAGYWVNTARFQLLGDRHFDGNETTARQNPGPTGAFCKCQQTSFPIAHEYPPNKLQERVIWRFQLQGHNEKVEIEITTDRDGAIGFSNRGTAATSVGILTVHYVPAHQ